ncbi:MAG: alpha/beta hydrolase [Myxococcaceae bacterium]
METREVSFFSEGVPIRGVLRLPAKREDKLPAVVLCVGFSLVKEVWLVPFAEAFAAAGYAALLIDYRGFGESGGEVRNRLVPQQQVEDVRNALTYLQTLPEVAEDRLAVFGISLGASVALGAAGVDPRVKALSFVAGPSDLKRVWTSFQGFPSFNEKVQAAQRKFVATGEVTYAKVSRLLSSDPETCAKIEAEHTRFPRWRPEVTFESLASLFEFQPEEVAAGCRASLFLYPAADELISRFEAVAAWNRAREPKRLIALEGLKHVDVYGLGPGFQPVVDQTLAFFRDHV